MRSVHLNPADAVKAHRDLGAVQSMGIHFGTFQLTLEGINEPVLALERALKKNKISADQFWTLSPGETKKVN